jgi:5-methylcytosine-specific restriction endonuclease McrA
VNRNKSLESRTALSRGTELRRRSGLARSSFKRPAASGDDPSPEVRAMVEGRDLGWCVRCGLAVGSGPQSVHHRIRRSQGGSHQPENLILLCGSGTTGCHGWVHAHPADARDSGWLLKSHEDPLAVPVAYARQGGGFSEYRLTAGGGRESLGQAA